MRECSARCHHRCRPPTATMAPPHPSSGQTQQVSLNTTFRESLQPWTLACMSIVYLEDMQQAILYSCGFSVPC